MQLDPILTTILLAGWGSAVKYLPALKNLPNRLIPWMNLALAVLLKLVSPSEAQAGTLMTVAGAWLTGHLGWFLPILQVILARQYHETWVRPTAELVAPSLEKKSVAPHI